MNQYPLWKYLLIIAILIPGLIYALPNLYGEDPAVQVSATRGAALDAAAVQRMESVLQAAGIEWIASTLDETGARFRFRDTDVQLNAKEALQRDLGDRFVVALSLLPATPAWLQAIDARPMYLGLDLRGGVHFLMEVDAAAAVRSAEERFVQDLRSTLREKKIRYLTVSRAETGTILVKFRDAQEREQAARLLDDEFRELSFQELERDGSPHLAGRLTEEEKQEIVEFALDQNMTSLRNRVNELGVAEPIIQRQGDRRIVVQLPGVQDTARAKDIIGRTATLEVMMVDEEHDYAVDKRVPPGSRLFDHRGGGQILLKKGVIYSGDNIVDAAAGIDSRDGGAVVHITLDSRGAAINQRITGQNIGKRMAIVYIEDRSEVKRDDEGKPVPDESGRPQRVKKRIEEVITAPVIRDQLGKRFQIEGMDSTSEAQDLALLLRAGALAAPIDIVEERTIGPSLGRENIAQGFRSVLIGFVLVLLFMAVYYRAFGLVANIALTMNLVLMVAVLSMFQATLTMPGVAGIVLTVGMAVDANVLIFERIREELRAGNTPQASIYTGYSQALSSIVDANITTLIAAIVLFNFGTGPIKGFAVTLCVGILTSMFTAIMGTRAVVNLAWGGRRLSSLPV
jgi:preprotein translocase subunit SecD